MGTASATLLTAPMSGPRVTRTTGASSSNSCLSLGSVHFLEVAPRLCELAPPRILIVLCDRRTVDEVKQCSTRKPSANSSKG
jgi:hypothetical protein